MNKAVLLAFAFFTSFLRAEQLPLEHFTNHGDYLDMQISPDGKHIFARARADGRVILLFIRSADGEVVGGVSPNKNDTIHTAHWVSANRVVYEFAEKMLYSDKPIPTGELFATNIDGSQHELLFGYRASDAKLGTRMSNKKDVKASLEILSMLPNDEKNILIIEYPWSSSGSYWYDNRVKQPILSRLNVYTGRKRKLGVLPYGRSYALANKQGDVNFMGWTDKQNTSHTLYRENNEAKWQLLETAFGVDTNTLPVALNHDGSKVYLGGRTGQKSIYTLFELDLESGSHKAVFEGNTSDIEDWIVDFETEEPVVGVSYPNKQAYHYALGDSKSSALHKMLVPAFGDQEVLITSSSLDGSEHLIHVSSDTNPGEYYVFNTDSKDAKFIWANRSWIDPRNMLKKHPFKILARDKIELNGYLTLPSQKDKEEKPPMVVMIHGGPRARDFPSFDTEVQLLANRGFAVLQVNYRGSHGYGSQFVELGNRQWGGKMIDDIIDATKWAIKNDKVAPENICVYGASYGGYASLMATIKAPDLYQCAVGYVGIYDLEYMYSESDIPDNWGGKAYLKEVLGNNTDELKAYSPLYNIEQINVPILLIHGDKDRRVPVINAEELEKKLKQAGKPVTTLRYQLSGHGVYDSDSRKELYQGLIDFFNEHIHH